MEEFNSKILICPDKFKGTLNAKQVSEAIYKGIINNSEGIALDIEIMPLADGGQGSVQILFNYFSMRKQLSYRPEWVHLQAQNPLFKTIETKYFIHSYSGKRTAFIESAYVSGLALLNVDQRNPEKTSTFGTGELIKHAILQSQAQLVYLFVGGSATNDGGIGALQAIGFEFYQQNQYGVYQAINKCRGCDLNRIVDIKFPQSQKIVLEKISKTKILICTDVRNILIGQKGASRVYGKQKGAKVEQIQRLDAGLKNIDALFYKLFGKQVGTIPGSGASGGLPASFLALLNTKQFPNIVEIRSGIQTIFHLTNFKQRLKDKQLVITGEGKVDEQTLTGKVVFGVYQQCKENQLPLWIVCGVNQLTESEQKQMRQSYKNIEFIQLVDSQTSLQESKMNTVQSICKKVGKMYKQLNRCII